MITPWLLLIIPLFLVLSYRSRNPERQLDYALSALISFALVVLGMGVEVVVG